MGKALMKEVMTPEFEKQIEAYKEQTKDDPDATKRLETAKAYMDQMAQASLIEFYDDLEEHNSKEMMGNPKKLQKLMEQIKQMKTNPSKMPEALQTLQDTDVQKE